MEAFVFILAWGSAIVFAVTRLNKYKAGILFVVGAILASWIGVLIAWAICEAIESKAPQTVQPQPIASNSTLSSAGNSIINVEDFIQDLTKVKKLSLAGMLDAEEVANRKSALIMNLATKKIAGHVDDILLAIVPLKESNFLLDSDVAQIKKMLMINNS